MKLWQKYKTFYLRTWIWKCHFIEASISLLLLLQGSNVLGYGEVLPEVPIKSEPESDGELADTGKITKMYNVLLL